MSSREKIQRNQVNTTTIRMRLDTSEDVMVSIGDVHFTLGSEDILEMAEVITSKRLAQYTAKRARDLLNKMEGE